MTFRTLGAEIEVSGQSAEEVRSVGESMVGSFLNRGDSRPSDGANKESKVMKQHVVISLHGIRTRGEWQKRFAPELSAAELVPMPLDYGFFGAIKLLNPWARRKQVDWLRDQYTLVRQRFPEASISIVAHSLGSYLVARSMEIYQQIVFDRIIFCGAIVRRDYPWSTIKARSQVSRVLNDYGHLDFWSRIVAWVVDDAGQSGLRGFAPGNENYLVQHPHPEFRHSDYFYTLNYQHNWIPFLKGLDPSPTAIISTRPRNWRFAITMSLLILVIVFALVGLVFSYVKPLWQRENSVQPIQQSARFDAPEFPPIVPPIFIVKNDTEFFTKTEIIAFANEWLRRFKDESVQDTLLVYQTDTQQRWLATTQHQLFMILDSLDREPNSKRTCSLLRAIPLDNELTAEVRENETGAVSFSLNKGENWSYYSANLLGEPERAKQRIQRFIAVSLERRKKR